MNFAETVAGQRFLNHDFPSLVKSAERIAKAMEEQNKTAAKPYLLISVLDREITAEQFPSLEQRRHRCWLRLLRPALRMPIICISEIATMTLKSTKTTHGRTITETMTGKSWNWR